ncbi:hypothetical protein BUALT_Bualt07G0176600 [Buddleja alternifolia]|uniref:Uncharacterized protein n=1 Tax=Buddleja alternifolia TaxID=168488 RepID=A0AAV6XI51_9LAMI|nr:hypothetical protein BUALT_Bualt07G0176600 [Buddleja alternifolia]
MDFFKLNKFRKAHKPDPNNLTQDHPVPQPEEPENGTPDVMGKSVNLDSTNNAEMEDDDDDFITNEVKRRLKELRRNSFMVLIPEETSPAADDEEEEEEEEGETSSSEWRDVEAEGRQFWSGFDAVYDIYSDRMLFFDRLTSQQLLEAGCHVVATPSPRSASKKLASPLRCLSLKRFEAPEEEIEHLQQPVNDPYHDLETAYVAQVCLSWEALHCQYTQLTQKISCQPETPTSYNHSAQQFQQFEVLLQRFIENEPFELGSRPEIYARTRKSLPKLLQIPKILVLLHGFNLACEEKTTEEEASDVMVLAPDFIRIIESCILSFRQFIKTDKKKSGGVRNRFASFSLSPSLFFEWLELQKAMKVKEVWKKRKSYNKKKCWPSTKEEVEMLLGLIDVKVISRVVRMMRISKEQLFWCEEKMKKLGLLSDGKLQRDPSPTLFPCH